MSQPRRTHVAPLSTAARQCSRGTGSREDAQDIAEIVTVRGRRERRRQNGMVPSDDWWQDGTTTAVVPRGATPPSSSASGRPAGGAPIPTDAPMERAQWAQRWNPSRRCGHTPAQRRRRREHRHVARVVQPLMSCTGTEPSARTDRRRAPWMSSERRPQPVRARLDGNHGRTRHLDAPWSI